MIIVIILTAVRKGYKQSATCSILPCDSLLVRTTSFRRDVMTQCHARISRENQPVALKLKNIIIS